MAKKKAPEPAPPEERVTVLNLKGSVAERDYLRRVSKVSGIPAAEIARRAMTKWISQSGILSPDDRWPRD